MSQYQTVVGNVGTVYDGTNGFEAHKQFYIYVSNSKLGYGRAANERVVVLRDDEIVKEYIPTGEDNDG